MKKQKNDWIKSSERLPRRGQIVQAYGIPPYGRKKQVLCAVYNWKDGSSDLEFQWMSEYMHASDRPLKNIEYWRPLSNPPLIYMEK